MTLKRLSATMVASVIAAALCSMMPTGAMAAVTGTRAAAASSSTTWGTAEEVPGTAALNKGGYAAIDSVSCASAGNCSAGGSYSTSGGGQALVVGETNGTWGTAEEVPGSAALNAGGEAFIDSLSCASAGNCSAGGMYSASNGYEQALVVTETNGTWGTAEEAPGSGALNTEGQAFIDSVSCGSAGNCAAGGSYQGSGGQPAFVVSETNGTWSTAKEVPGSAALNQGGYAQVNSVSCASAGNCSAGGFYTDGSGFLQAFVVGETNGTWGTAKEVPGSGTLNKHGGGSQFREGAQVSSVSCASAGNCSAGGFYADGSGDDQAFAVGETNSTWGTAEEVPGTAALNAGGGAQIDSVSCASAGNCSAGGTYAAKSFGDDQAFVVSEANGIWGTAEQVPGTAVLNAGGYAEVYSVSCASAGNCSAGGYYADGSDHQQALLVDETNGTWGTAEEVPGSGALNGGDSAQINSVSCAPAGNCSAGGYYTDGSGNAQAFVVGQTSGGGYPYANAVCEWPGTPQSNPHCVNPADPKDQNEWYEWGYWSGSTFEPYDQWGYEYRNCTSYVAWRLSSAGVSASVFKGLGNADQWIGGVSGKSGVTVNSTASPGAVAVWDSPGVGHVAWVESVSGGKVTVSDYNYLETGAYDKHLISSTPAGYIHFP
jgi:surface antigen